MKKTLILMVIVVFLFQCSGDLGKNKPGSIPEKVIASTTQQLLDKYGDTDRIKLGVKQAALLWQKTDGTSTEFQQFCLTNFVDSADDLKILFQKLSRNYEILIGNFHKMKLELKEPLDLDRGKITDVDRIFGAFSPDAHFKEDLFKSKAAFLVNLNFPPYSLKEIQEQGNQWTRLEWAYARTGNQFTSRVPAKLIKDEEKVMTEARAYISEYTVYMGNLLNNEGKTLFPKELKLISHWGLRDELKANYRDKNRKEKQDIIYEVMKRIITQTIPREVINNNVFQWNPYSNKLFKSGAEVAFTAEPDTRYETLLGNFKIKTKLDPYYPNYKNVIQRRFEKYMEIAQSDVQALFTKLLTSAQRQKVAETIKKRLGRGLYPYDIWYDGFETDNNLNRDALDKKIKKKYPSNLAFEKDIPRLLRGLGFTRKKAQEIASKITVDASRGAGHASGAEMKSDKSHLRTRVSQQGMTYKGYNIAMHELGHNVEQTITLQDVDYYMMHGVPNTALTEALAFIFQKRDLPLLGIPEQNPNKHHLMALDIFWSSYEIMGVSMVDMEVWKWLYENPSASPEELKNAVISIAKKVWNQYFADIFQTKDEPILAIYSHMISYPLYLSAYPMGHLAEFQIEKYLEGKHFAREIQRIYQQGAIVPQLWMKNAVGTEISVDPLLKAVDEALKAI